MDIPIMYICHYALVYADIVEI